MSNYYYYHRPGIAKDKICDDTNIELEVEPRAQWILGRRENSIEIRAPLAPESWLLKDRVTEMSINTENTMGNNSPDTSISAAASSGGDWLSQVEIITHAGPHRRLWMGPQFMFKTYNTPSGYLHMRDELFWDRNIMSTPCFSVHLYLTLTAKPLRLAFRQRAIDQHVRIQ